MAAWSSFNPNNPPFTGTGASMAASYAMVGITKLAPLFTPGVQRCVTVLVLV
jgi:hypothetical protein